MDARQTAGELSAGSALVASRSQRLDAESSSRLDALRFPLIVGVVFIHAYGGTVAMADGAIGASRPGALVDAVTGVISQGIARVAVPLFFLVAGYLFFLGFENTAASYAEKLRSRTRTLLIPFLFWNLVTLAIHALAQSLPQTRGFFSGRNELVAAFEWFDYLNAVFGFDQRPIAYQFWFIRDLMLLVLLAPAVGVLIRVAPAPFLALVLVGWLADVWPIYAPSAEASLFFCAGAWYASQGASLFRLDRWGAYFGVAFVPMVVSDVLLMGHPLHGYLHRIAIVVGMVAVLWLSRFAIGGGGLSQRLQRLGRSSFFVFAVHEPLLTIFKKLAYRLTTPSAPSSILLIYFLVPIVTMLIAILVHRALLHIAPRFAAVVTGGR